MRNLVGIFLLCLGTAAVAAEPFTAEHLVQIDRVGAPVVSPSGDKIVYAVRHADVEANTGRYDLWLSNIDGGEPVRLTTHEASDTSPAFSPDGRYVLFLSSRGGSTQVWRVPMSGGEAQPVTDLPLDVGSFRLSPTGDYLIVSLSVYPDCDDLDCTAERDEAANHDKVTAQRYDRLFMRHWDHWLDDRRSQLFSLRLDEHGRAGDAIARLSKLDADVPSRVWGGNEEYAIAPDGRTVYFAARLRDRHEPMSTNFDIYSVSIDGRGDLENLTANNPAWDTAPIVSPDGRYLAWAAMSRPGFESDQFQVMLRDRKSSKTRSLTDSWDRSPANLAFTRDGKAILMNAQDVGQNTLWRLPLDGGQPEKLVAEGSVSGFDDAGGGIVFALDNLASPAELHVLDSRHGDARRITNFGKRTLADVTMGDFEQFSFDGAGGDTVYGFVVRPAGFERGKKYAVAFIIHGGPESSSSNNFHYRWNPQTYAGQGFAVVMIDFHGSTGYGQAFTDAIPGDWGGKPLQDLRLGLDAALQQFGFLDGDRVCALGASYGGYMINWIAGNWPDRFRCLVNHDGIFDNRMMYYATEELWLPEWENGGPYYAVPKAYEKHNPVNFVDNWKTPMLVIHGQLDYRVPVTQGIATFTALQRKGIESRFLYFPDENHWVLKPANSVRWHREVNAWLHEHLDD